MTYSPMIRECDEGKEKDRRSVIKMLPHPNRNGHNMYRVSQNTLRFVDPKISILRTEKGNMTF